MTQQTRTRLIQGNDQFYIRNIQTFQLQAFGLFVYEIILKETSSISKQIIKIAE